MLCLAFRKAVDGLDYDRRAGGAVVEIGFDMSHVGFILESSLIQWFECIMMSFSITLPIQSVVTPDKSPISVRSKCYVKFDIDSQYATLHTSANSTTGSYHPRQH